MNGNEFVTVRDVGPRDGLQSLAVSLSVAAKTSLVQSLAAAGVQRIEAGSFVNPRAVPPMADSGDVFLAVGRPPGARLEALVLDERGARQALDAGAGTLVTVVAASDTFSQRNVRRSTAEALSTAAAILALSRAAGVPCVVDIATAFGCAFEGAVPASRVAWVAAELADQGFEEITLADTTGLATPHAVGDVLATVRDTVTRPLGWGLHFHNTRGLGLVNVMAGLEAGVRLFDASVGGIGGCPFSPGATGNICTEDLVNLLRSLGFDTGIDLAALVDAARRLEVELGFQLPGQLMRTDLSTLLAA